MSLEVFLFQLQWSGIGGVLTLLPVLILVRYFSLQPAMKVWICRLVFLKLLLSLCFSISVDSKIQVFANKSSVVSPLVCYFLVLMWAIGALVVLRHWNLELQQARMLQGVAFRIVDDNVTVMARQYRIDVQQLAVDGLTEPCVVGLFRPSLVIPTNWTFDRGTLSHEFAHVRNRDILWNFIIGMAFAFFWFVPGLGLILKELALWQEVRADQMARDWESITPGKQADKLLNTIQVGSTDSWACVKFSGSSDRVARRLSAMYCQRCSFTLAVVSFAIVACLLIPFKVSSMSADRSLVLSPRSTIPQAIATLAN